MKTVIYMAAECMLFEELSPDEFEAALFKFAELVRKDYSTTHANLWLDRIHKFMLEEREACAKVIDEMAEDMEREMEPSTAIAYVRSKAAAIRARGETK